MSTRTRRRRYATERRLRRRFELVVLDDDGPSHITPSVRLGGLDPLGTSGAHFYAWDHPFPLFSVDVYTCKPFDVADLVFFTAEYFSVTELEHRSV